MDASAEPESTILTSPVNKDEKKEIGYLIDMDGVIYKGNKLIPGSDLFVQILLEKQMAILKKD